MKLLLWALLAWCLWVAGQGALTVAAVQTGPAVKKRIITKAQARVLVERRRCRCRARR